MGVVKANSPAYTTFRRTSLPGASRETRFHPGIASRQTPANNQRPYQKTSKTFGANRLVQHCPCGGVVTVFQVRRRQFHWRTATKSSMQWIPCTRYTSIAVAQFAAKAPCFSRSRLLWPPHIPLKDTSIWTDTRSAQMPYLPIGHLASQPFRRGFSCSPTPNCFPDKRSSRKPLSTSW